MYPFKAEEFGQLSLPENVIKAKLVSLNNYGAAVPANLLTGNRGRHQVSESQMSGTYYLFTVEENDYLTLYKIKSYLASPISNVISNFKMAKKTSLLLEYPVQVIEWISQDTSANRVLSYARNGDISPEAFRRSK